MDKDVIVASEAEQTGDVGSSNTIWNEGRVVGYSAYEVYVRQHMLEDPETPPASEREWLAASLASGASILLYVPKSERAKGTNWIYDVDLPSNTKLCAASTIVASLFYGEGNQDRYNFATHVESYGELIDRSAIGELIDRSAIGSVMLNSTSNVPTEDKLEENSWLRKVRSYLHILDGIVIQPGKWFTNAEGNVDFTPDLKSEGSPKIRLHIRGPIDDPFWIVLSGFTMKHVVAGTTKVAVTNLDSEIYDKTFTSSLKSDHPENGDFLGPEMYPWANKIIFTVPSQAATTPLLKTKIDGRSIQLNDTPIIDLEHCNPKTYYQSNHKAAPYTNASIEELVTIQDGVAMLATHQRSGNFAPALYGALHGNYSADKQNIKLNPIDTVAPRTIKLFHGDIETETDLATSFEGVIPYNFALIRRDTDYVLQHVKWNHYKNDGTPDVDSGYTILPVAETESPIKESSSYPDPKVEIKSGTQSVTCISLTYVEDGQVKSYNLGGNNYNDDTINWQMLLDCLRDNTSIDVIGDALREFKQTIIDIFNRNDIDTDKQYVVIFKESNGGYTLDFEELVLPPTVSFQVIQQGNYYILRANVNDATTGSNETYDSISLRNTQGRQLEVTGEAEDTDLKANGVLTWGHLLDALGGNKSLHLVDGTLLQLKNNFNRRDTAAGSYLITKDSSGNLSLSPPAAVNIPEFPSYILQSIKCNPTPVGSAKMCNTITLDVFGYIHQHGDLSSLNTFSTLTHTSGNWTGTASYGIVQNFTVDSGSWASWAAICKALTNAGSLVEEEHAKVIFTTGGRPIYCSSKLTSETTYYKYHICAPRSSISVVAYIQPIKLDDNGNYVKTYKYTKDSKGEVQNENGQTIVNASNPVRGMIIWCDYHKTSGWKSAPSGGSYTGSLVGDRENQYWTKSYTTFEV